MCCFKADFHEKIFLHENLGFMYFHGVVNHIILVWDYLSTCIALLCTVFSYVDKLPRGGIQTTPNDCLQETTESTGPPK